MEMPGEMSHASIPEAERRLPADLIRIAVGIEDVGDLIRGLREALAGAKEKIIRKIIPKGAVNVPDGLAYVFLLCGLFQLLKGRVGHLYRPAHVIVSWCGVGWLFSCTEDSIAHQRRACIHIF